MMMSGRWELSAIPLPDRRSPGRHELPEFPDHADGIFARQSFDQLDLACVEISGSI
jgi:hypothetical protein